MISLKIYNDRLENFKNYKTNNHLLIDNLCNELNSQCDMIIKDTQYDIQPKLNYKLVRLLKKDHFYIYCYFKTFEYLQDQYYKEYYSENVLIKIEEIGYKKWSDQDNIRRIKFFRTLYITRHTELNKFRKRKGKREAHIAKHKHRKYFKDFIKEDLIKAAHNPARYSFFEYELDD